MLWRGFIMKNVVSIPLYKNGKLLVNGSPVNQLDFDSFATESEMGEWAFDAWASIEEHAVTHPEFSTQNVTDFEDVFGTLFVRRWNSAILRIMQPKMVKARNSGLNFNHYT
jgi:hypothetical protein